MQWCKNSIEPSKLLSQAVMQCSRRTQAATLHSSAEQLGGLCVRSSERFTQHDDNPTACPDHSLWCDM